MSYTQLAESVDNLGVQSAALTAQSLATQQASDAAKDAAQAAVITAQTSAAASEASAQASGNAAQVKVDTFKTALATDGDTLIAKAPLWFPTPYLDTLSKLTQGEQISIFRFIPEAEIAKCRLGTSDFEVQLNLEEALARAVNLLVPYGVYMVRPIAGTAGVANEYAAGKVCLPIRSAVRITGNGTFRLAPGSYGTTSGAIFGTPDGAVEGISLEGITVDGNNSLTTGPMNGVHLVGPVGASLKNLTCKNAPAYGAIGGVNFAIRSSAGARQPVDCAVQGVRSLNAGYIGAQFDRCLGLAVDSLMITGAVDNGLDIFGNIVADGQEGFGSGRRAMFTNVAVKDVGGSAVFFESAGDILMSSFNLRNFGNGGLFYNRINSGAAFINAVNGRVGNDSGVGTGVIFKNNVGRGVIDNIQFEGLDYSFDARTAQYMHIKPCYHRNIGKEILKTADSADAFWRGRVDQQIYRGSQDATTLMPQMHSPTDNPIRAAGRINPYNPDTAAPNIANAVALSTGLPFPSINYTRKAVTMALFPSTALYSKFEAGETLVYLSGVNEPSVGDLALINGEVWQYFSRPTTSNFVIRKYVSGSFLAGDYTATLNSALPVKVKLPAWLTA